MKNQKGFAPIAIILIAVVILGAVGYTLTKGKTGGGITLPKIGGPALNANCELKDPDLCKYVNRSMTGDFFKNGMVMNTVTTDKNGKKSESLFEIDGKENSRMMSYQDGKETMGIVNLNKISYMKDLTDGKWWKYESNTDQKSETKDQKPENIKEQMKKYAEEYKDKTTYKKIGKETCGALTCFKYQMILTDMPDYTQYIYFDDREYLMRKTRTEDKSGMITETSYEYKSVTIKEPSPIKEGSPWGNVMNNNPSKNGSGISDEELKNIQEQIQNQSNQSEGD